jgi:hypothetical protein
MRYLIFSIILSVLCACHSKIKAPQVTKCFIKYDSLFKIIDTANLEITRGTDSAAIEILDPKSNSGERGILRFDDNDNLRFYAFLYNEHNDFSFFVTYDSLGNKFRSSNSEVVRWIFYSPKDSTVKFTFLLCALDRNYADITIKSGKFVQDHITLYQSKFVKLICANISINKTDLDTTNKIYITGRWQDKCSKEEQEFTDSTNVL